MKTWNLAAELRASYQQPEPSAGRKGGSSAAAGPTLSLGAENRPVPSAGITEGKLTGEKGKVLVGLHWVNASGPVSRLDEMKTIISARWGEPDLIEAGRLYYQRHYKWASGVLVCFSDHREDCTVSVNGDAVSMLAVDDQMRLLRQVHGLGFRTSRVDVKADDVGRMVPLSSVHSAAEAGHFVGFKLTQPHRPQKLVKGEMVLTGDMRTFGRRGATYGSGAYYRVYDKGLESDGELDAIRWEVEFSAEKAHEVGRVLANCETVDEFVRTMASLVGGNIDFREGDSTHVKRRRRLDWWQAFVDLLGSAKISVERAKAPLQAALASVKRQYSSTLAKAKIVCDRVGVDFLTQLREMVLQACSIVNPDKLDERDLRLNVAEAFRLRGRRLAFAPASALCREELPF